MCLPENEQIIKYKVIHNYERLVWYDVIIFQDIPVPVWIVLKYNKSLIIVRNFTIFTSLLYWVQHLDEIGSFSGKYIHSSTPFKKD